MILAFSILFAISIAGLTYVIGQAVLEGMKAYSGAYSQKTALQFEDIFLFIPPRRIAEIGWASAAVLFLLVFLLVGSTRSLLAFSVGIALGIIAGIVGLQTPSWILKYLKQRRLRRFNLQLVDTLISMSNALKAGFSIMQAFESVVREGQNPISQEFGLFLHQTRVGVSFSEALENLDRRVGSEDLTLVIQAIETARRTGGNLTEIFEKIAAMIRERMRIENRIRTLTAQARLQGIVVALMPVIIAVAMMMVRPSLMMPFLHSLAGLAVFVMVAGLIAAGGLIIRKIINIDV